MKLLLTLTIELIAAVLKITFKVAFAVIKALVRALGENGVPATENRTSAILNTDETGYNHATGEYVQPRDYMPR